MKTNDLKRFAFALIIVFGIVLVGLAILVHYHGVLGTDVFLSRDLQSEGDTPERRTLIYHALYFISLFGKPVISAMMAGLFGLFFWFYRYYRETIFILLTPIAAGVNSLIKIIVNRPRPTGNLIKVMVTETDASFPSGHVNFYTVFFGLLFVMLFYTPRIPQVIRRLIQAISIFMIVSISFSRVYLGAHWVTDTIGGYLLGSILLGIYLYFYLKPKLQSNYVRK